MGIGMEQRNPGCDLDLDWIAGAVVNLPAVNNQVQALTQRRTVKKEWQPAWLLRAVTCLDLTTLSGDDTTSNVQRLCHKAINPISLDILDKLGMKDVGIKVGAVCVYPARVVDCSRTFDYLGSQVPIAAVATGFPSGQYHLSTRLSEIEATVADGASEIDVVINRCAALQGDWTKVYEEVREMKRACGNAHMKTILATGELGSMSNVYRASLVCMTAGADFIKTSTGKEIVNATLPVGLVMTMAIRDYWKSTGYKVGLKPAGGIRTWADVLNWQILMKEELGDDWLKPNLFRIGASALLTDIEKELYVHAYSTQPKPYQLSFV